jgi:hypothetical protein
MTPEQFRPYLRRRAFRDKGEFEVGPIPERLTARDYHRHTVDVNRPGPVSFEAEARAESGKAPVFWWGILIGTVLGIVISWYCPWVRR